MKMTQIASNKMANTVIHFAKNDSKMAKLSDSSNLVVIVSTKNALKYGFSGARTNFAHRAEVIS